MLTSQKNSQVILPSLNTKNNPQGTLKNVNVFKKMMFEQVQAFNRQLQIQKKQRARKIRRTETSQDISLNNIALQQFQQSKQYEIKRRLSMQQQLKQEYLKQMKIKERLRTEAELAERTYGQIENQRLLYQNARREKQILKNIKQVNQGKLNNYLRQSDNAEDGQIQTFFNHRSYSLKPDRLGQSASIYHYKTELRGEAQRRKKQQKERQEMRIQLEKQLLRKQRQNYQQQLEGLKMKRLNQKQRYRRDLDFQIELKRQIQLKGYY